MVITWFGRNCFRLEGQSVSILTDPYTAQIGLTPPRLTPDIVTRSHDAGDDITLANVSEDVFRVDSPGEYEVRGAFIRTLTTATTTGDQNLVTFIQTDGLNLVHLGDLGHTLSDDQLEQLSRIDLLFVPVGGKPALDAERAVKVIGQIEPKLVIPMHYHLKGLRKPSAPLAEFLKELGGKKPDEQTSLRIKPRDLTGEEMVTVILNRP